MPGVPSLPAACVRIVSRTDQRRSLNRPHSSDASVSDAPDNDDRDATGGGGGRGRGALRIPLLPPPHRRRARGRLGGVGSLLPAAQRPPETPPRAPVSQLTNEPTATAAAAAASVCN